MDNFKVLIYDGSFNGFLTAVFTAFENNFNVLGFKRETEAQKGLFSDTDIITTQKSKAKIVWESIENKNHSAVRNIYFAFLSEAEGVDFMLYQYIKKLYGLLEQIDIEQLAIIEIKISKLAISVGREKAQIEDLLDFQSTKDAIYISEIAPGFNVLPLVSRHFRYRYSKHKWIIFDRKRNYGMYYNGKSVELISKETKNMYLNGNIGFNPYAESRYRLAI
ncbi:MAG: TIGR03915 family putative DNA repair protein [Maribacter sp.]